MKILIFLIASIGFLNLALAADSSTQTSGDGFDNYLLEDGVFNNSEGYCSFRITNDLPENAVLLTSSDVPGGLTCKEHNSAQYNRANPSLFLGQTFQAALDESDITKCQPNSDHSKPCYDELYDAQGNLTVKIGDLWSNRQYVKALNPKAFSVFTVQKWERDGQLIATVKSQPVLFYLAEAKPTLKNKSDQ